MLFLSGVGIASLSILVAILHLQQSVSYYFDFVGFVTVFGGTLAVGVITLPWEYRFEIMRGVRALAGRTKVQPSKDFLIECLGFVREPQSYSTSASAPSSAQEVLRDGAELISLGLRPDKIQAILEERIFQTSERYSKVANAFRALAKYPPAFGLAGTVLGLVSLMRAVSEGAGANETGIRMAVALTATFYGLLLANLIVNPAGEFVLKASNEEKKHCELALQTVLLAAERSSMLEAQEMLNSFVAVRDRVDVISGEMASADASAREAA
jgi:chemotaxis protein MotA